MRISHIREAHRCQSFEDENLETFSATEAQTEAKMERKTERI